MLSVLLKGLKMFGPIGKSAQCLDLFLVREIGLVMELSNTIDNL